MRLVYLSPLPWSSFVQRPHHFVYWFHRQQAEPGAEVLWIDPYPTRLPSLSDFVRKSPRANSFATPQPPWLRVIRPRAFPIEPLLGSGDVHRFVWGGIFRLFDDFCRQGPTLLVAGKPSELALQLFARAPDLPTIYDAMDDFPQFYRGLSRRSMALRERRLAEMASCLFVSSSELGKTLGAGHHNVQQVMNACSPASLPPVSALKSSSRLREKTLGFVGTIGDWFDWDWLYALAHAVPECAIRVIGPLHQPPPGGLPSNVTLLPACDHASAIDAMRQFDIGLIPFRNTALTRSVDPIKYYEYRALGLPVMSSRFGEMRYRGDAQGVRLCGLGDDFPSIVESLMHLHTSHEQIEAFRRQNSWDARFDAACVPGCSG